MSASEIYCPSPDWLCLIAMCVGFAVSILLSPFVVGFLSAVSSDPLLEFLADTSASQKSSAFFSSLHRAAVLIAPWSGLKAFAGRFLFYSALIYAGSFELAHQIALLLSRKSRLLRRLCKLLPFFNF